MYNKVGCSYGFSIFGIYWRIYYLRSFEVSWNISLRQIFFFPSSDELFLYRYTPGIQKHVTVLNTRNGTKVYMGMIKGELYLFSNNKQCGHLPTANVYIHIEYYF